MDKKNDGIDELKEKVARLEDMVANGNYAKQDSEKKPEVAKNKIKEEKKTEVKPRKSTEIAKNVDKKPDEKVKEAPKVENEVKINWNNILAKLKDSGKMIFYTNLKDTAIKQVGDLILEVEFQEGMTPFAQKFLEDNINKKELNKVLFEETGKEWHIKYVDLKSSSNKKVVKNNDLGIDINIIE